MRDIEGIELTESIHGEAILPREPRDEGGAGDHLCSAGPHAPGRCPIPTNEPLLLSEAIADHVWMDAPDDADYSTGNPGSPLHTFTDEQLRQHDAKVAADALFDAGADMRVIPTGDPGTAWANNDAADWLALRATRIRQGDAP